jgi:hypothetical protein
LLRLSDWLLATCTNFLNCWLCSSRWIMGWPGGSIRCEACPASSSGARRPPASSPRARRGHVELPPRARRRPPRVARLFCFLILVAVAVMPSATGPRWGGGRRARGGDARGGDVARRGGGAPRTKTSAGRQRGGGATTRKHSLTLNAPTATSTSLSLWLWLPAGRF